MKKLLYIIGISLATIATISCERRELSYDYKESIAINLNIDWSELGSGDEQPQYVKALFYPTDGSSVVERYVDWGGESVEIPYGEYRVIIYTWRVNAESQTVQFRGDSFDTFEAYTDEVTRSKVKSKATDDTRTDNETIISSPDEYLYSWSSEDAIIEVSKSQAKLQSKSDDESISIAAKMNNKIEHYNVSVDVTNAGAAVSITSAVSNTHSSIFLGSGSKPDGLVSTDVEPTRVSDDSDLSKYEFHIMTFGAEPVENNNLIIETTNSDNVITTHSTDITEVVNKTQSGELSSDETVDVTDKDNPVVVPPTTSDSGGGFAPPSVGDWEDGGNVVVPV